MRFIIFIKIPERIEPIPLDIIDDRPSQAVLRDILLLTKLSTHDQPNFEYSLNRNGGKFDPNKNLTENGVKNGDTLDVIKSTEQYIISPSKDEVKLDTILNATTSEPEEEFVNKKKLSKKKLDSPPIPGKKIDFD